MHVPVHNRYSGEYTLTPLIWGNSAQDMSPTDQEKEREIAISAVSEFMS